MNAWTKVTKIFEMMAEEGGTERVRQHWQRLYVRGRVAVLDFVFSDRKYHSDQLTTQKVYSKQCSPTIVSNMADRHV